MPQSSCLAAVLIQPPPLTAARTARHRRRLSPPEVRRRPGVQHLAPCWSAPAAATPLWVSGAGRGGGCTPLPASPSHLPGRPPSTDRQPPRPPALPAGHLSHAPQAFSALHRPDVTFSCGGLMFPAHSVLLAGGCWAVVGAGSDATSGAAQHAPTCYHLPSPPLQSPRASGPSSSVSSRARCRRPSGEGGRGAVEEGRGQAASRGQEASARRPQRRPPFHPSSSLHAAWTPSSARRCLPSP